MVLIRKLEEDGVVLYLLQPSQVPQPTCQAGTRICFSPFFKKLHFPLDRFPLSLPFLQSLVHIFGR